MYQRDYEEVILQVPRVLRVIGEESVKRGADRLSSSEIDQIIRSTRARGPRRRKR